MTDVGTSALAVQALHFPNLTLGSCHRELSVRRAYCPLYAR